MDDLTTRPRPAGARGFPYATYPFGWFSALYAEELPPDEVVSVFYLGRDLVVWRDGTGAPHVTGAVCPHMGASFAYGGRVEDGCLRCPFHGWRYDGAGECASVPYSERLNPRARADAYPTVERNGHVCFWYHPHGAPPMWEVPEVPEYSSADYTGYDHRHAWTFNTVWHEVRENAVDMVHTGPLHGLEATPTFAVVEPSGHEFRTVVVQTTASGAPMGQDQDRIDTTMVGPGMTVVRMIGSLEVCIVTASTPVDEDHVSLRIGVMAKRRPTAEETDVIGALVRDGMVTLFDQDGLMWEHKVYLDRPALVPEDGPIVKFRRWASQFHVDAQLAEAADGVPALAGAAR